MKARLILLAGLLLAACQRETHPQAIPARIILDPGIPLTRATDPDEQLISDYNLLIFNAFGVLEEKVYIPRRKMVFSGGKLVHETTLLLDVPYSIYAVANLGYELPCRTLEEVRSYRYHLAYPDEYSRGIPMAGKLEEEAIGHSGTLTLPLERLMARVNLSIDRSALDVTPRRLDQLDLRDAVEILCNGFHIAEAVLFGESE